MPKAPFRPRALIVAAITVLSLASFSLAAEPFPHYDAIQPNVSFWIKTYSKYTTQQAVVHDSRQLDIIYDVIELKPDDAPRARKINRKRMKMARIKYQKILEYLAAHPATKKRAPARVAKLFGPDASARAFRLAARQVRCQIGQSDRFLAGLIRSGAFIERIQEIFVANGLPIELAYLPHVESSFNYQAYSKFGAAGIWQFTRSTGKRYMQVGYVLDERRDPLRATHAAVALLKDNYQKLGSWPLAITAYNHGASGMARAKQKYGNYPAIFNNYRSRTFRFASRNFYSEFLAAVEVASNYKSYFGDLTLDRPAPTRTIRLTAYADFDDLCRHFGVSAEIAKSLNPSLRSPVFNGQKYVPAGYTFRIPAGLEMAAARPSPLPSALYKDQQKPSRFYTVQRGDTAGRIARANNVKLSDLILANNLGHRAAIYPRQTLRIPVPGASSPRLANPPPENPVPALLADADASKPEKVESADSAPAEPKKSYPEPVLASVMPTAVPKVQPAAVPDDLLPTDEQVPSAEVVAIDVGFLSVQPHPRRPTGTIQVEVEETLGHFGEWAAVRTQEIRRLNRLPFGRKLRLHQKVKIPLRKTSAQVFEEQRYEFHKRLQEDFFAVYRISEMRAYRVQRGDNLWTLCLNKFDIPMWLLKNCNPEIDFAALHIQQKLRVPIIEKQSMDAQENETDSEPEESEPEEMQEPEIPFSLL